MEIRLLEQDKEKLSFLLKGATAAYVNALRRYIMEEVPVMAIETVEFRKNNSILYDEMIAHRLGLIPLTTDLKSYNLPEKCKCEGKGCARCQLSMTLKTKESGIVYASEIKSKDSAIKPTHPKMPIVKLLKGQSLEFEATAQLGKGKTHAKWSPGLIYYKKRCTLEINNSKISDKQMCVDMVPKGILVLENGQVAVVKEHVLDVDLCDAAAEAFPEGIIITPTDDFILYMESWGQIDCKKIMLEAINEFNEQLGEFQEKVKALK